MTYSDRQLFADTAAAIEDGREEDAASLLARKPSNPDLQTPWSLVEDAFDAGDDETALLLLRSIEW